MYLFGMKYIIVPTIRDDKQDLYNVIYYCDCTVKYCTTLLYFYISVLYGRP